MANLSNRLAKLERRLDAEPEGPLRTREDFERAAARRPLCLNDLNEMDRLGLFTQEEKDRTDAELREWCRQRLPEEYERLDGGADDGPA